MLKNVDSIEGLRMKQILAVAGTMVLALILMDSYQVVKAPSGLSVVKGGQAVAAPYRPQLLVPLLQRSGLTAPSQPDSCPSGSGPEPSCQRPLKSVSYEAPLSNLRSSALATISRLCASAKKSQRTA